MSGCFPVRTAGSGNGSGSGGGRKRRGASRGYTLVLVMVLVTVLSIGLAAAGPYWSKVIQREKEEELIFRGVQYAEAIRVFQQRFGRQPTRLEELLEVEPRSIRQLWDDPFSEDGEWSVIFGAGQGGAGGAAGGAQGDPDELFAGPGGQAPQGQGQPQPVQPGQPQQLAGGTGAAGSAGGTFSSSFFGGDDEDTVRVGPIQGVHSKSEETGYRLFQGNDKYSQWRFTPDILPPVSRSDGQPRDPYIGTDWMTRQLPEWAGVAGLGGTGAESDPFGQLDQEAGDQDGDQEDPFGFGDAGDDPFGFDESEDPFAEDDPFGEGFFDDEGGGGDDGGG